MTTTFQLTCACPQFIWTPYCKSSVQYLHFTCTHNVCYLEDLLHVFFSFAFSVDYGCVWIWGLKIKGTAKASCDVWATRGKHALRRWLNKLFIKGSCCKWLHWVLPTCPTDVLSFNIPALYLATSTAISYQSKYLQELFTTFKGHEPCAFITAGFYTFWWGDSAEGICWTCLRSVSCYWLWL